MAGFKLFAEDEETKYISTGKDEQNRKVEIVIQASTPQGAAKVLDNNASDYGLKSYTLPAEDITADA